MYSILTVVHSSGDVLSVDMNELNDEYPLEFD